MRDEFLVFGRPVIEDAEIAEVVDSLRVARIGIGPKVRRFEERLGDYVGAPHVRCSSRLSRDHSFRDDSRPIGSRPTILPNQSHDRACLSYFPHNATARAGGASSPDPHS
jgi:hypothetical protein